MKLLRELVSNLSVKNDFIFVSVGANDGIFIDEVYQSGLLTNKWRSYFIEPVKTTFDKLVSNYNSLYPNNNFVYENSAIYIEDGFGQLITRKYDDSNGLCSFFRKYKYDESVSYQVNTITFKTFLQRYNISHIDFLKVDCEGMDSEIVLQCFDNKIFPDVILYEDIEQYLKYVMDHKPIRRSPELVATAQSAGYVLIENDKEKQSEVDNKLLVKAHLLN